MEIKLNTDQLAKAITEALTKSAQPNTAKRKTKEPWKTPRLSIDKDGFWLEDVHLPMVTRFSLKDDGGKDGCFILDIELEVTL